MPEPARRRSSGLPAALAGTWHGVVRPVDASTIYAHPNQEFRRLAERGLLRRIATGYYVPVPEHARGRQWWPSLEAAAFGIPAADYGPDGAILMGLSAARLHGVIPRALAVAIVAVDRSRPKIILTEPPATVLFVRRNTGRLDAERTSTDLGQALVTTSEQTLLDLAHRPALGGLPDEARTAVRALWSEVDRSRLDRIAEEQRLRAALARAKTWVRE